MNALPHYPRYLTYMSEGELTEALKEQAEKDSIYKLLTHIFRFSTNTFALVAGIFAHQSYSSFSKDMPFYEKFWRFFLGRILKVYPCYFILNVVLNYKRLNNTCSASEHFQLLTLLTTYGGENHCFYSMWFMIMISALSFLAPFYLAGLELVSRRAQYALMFITMYMVVVIGDSYSELVREIDASQAYVMGIMLALAFKDFNSLIPSGVFS